MGPGLYMKVLLAERIPQGTAESVLSSLKILREASVHVLRLIRQNNSHLPGIEASLKNL